MKIATGSVLIPKPNKDSFQRWKFKWSTKKLSIMFIKDLVGWKETLCDQLNAVKRKFKRISWWTQDGEGVYYG